MKLKTVYLLLCFAGLLLPYWQFIPWMAENGLHVRFFMQQLFANRVSGFFAMDVLVSAVVLVVFMRSEGDRVSVPGRWFCLLTLLIVGVSLALPLFLYMREISLEQLDAGAPNAKA
jgi:lipid-A-disaccharide synthase-like uncharacterized protein